MVDVISEAAEKHRLLEKFIAVTMKVIILLSLFLSVLFVCVLIYIYVREHHVILGTYRYTISLTMTYWKMKKKGIEAIPMKLQ